MYCIRLINIDAENENDDDVIGIHLSFPFFFVAMISTVTGRSEQREIHKITTESRQVCFRLLGLFAWFGFGS